MLESGKYSIYFLMGTSSHRHMWISCVLSFGTQSLCIEPMSDFFVDATETQLLI